MTIDEAIKSRYERFNRLWLAAEGHTFEDDPKVKKEKFDREFPEWEKKVNKRANELGFEDHDEYWEYVCKRQFDDNDPDFERDPIIQDLWGKQPHYSSLYDYEKMCIDEGRGIAEFILSMEGDTKENWEKLWKPVFMIMKTTIARTTKCKEYTVTEALVRWNKKKPVITDE